MSYRLKHLLRMKYGDALAADTRELGDILVYGSNGPVGEHSRRNTGVPAIIVGRKGSHGKVTWAKDGGFCIDTALYVDNTSCAGDLRYAYYLLQTLCLDEPSKDFAVPGLDRFEAHNKPIPYVDRATQEAIANFLDREILRIDRLIKKREAFLSLIAEKTASIAAKIVDGSILYDKREGALGWFGQLSNDWQVRRAKFLFRERQDRSQTGEEELLSVSHITGVTRRSEKDVNMFLAESNEDYKLVFPGDVVINTMWAWMGAMGVSTEEGLISPSYGVYAPTTHDYEFAYFDLLLRSSPFIAEATRRSKGIHSSRLRLYPDAFLDIPLPVPPKNDQQAILATVKALTERDELLAASRKSLERLHEFRSALITAAVTGQIDVATWGKHGESDRRLDHIEEEMALKEAHA